MKPEDPGNPEFRPVAHEKLPDADAAEDAKAQWKKRVAALKSFLSRADDRIGYRMTR